MLTQVDHHYFPSHYFRKFKLNNPLLNECHSVHSRLTSEEDEITFGGGGCSRCVSSPFAMNVRTKMWCNIFHGNGTENGHF